jgi:hypothetical protein
MVAEGNQGRKRSQVMALRRDRKSVLLIPVAPDVTHIAVDLRTEWIDGRPVVRYYLPEGGKIEHRRSDETKT